MNLPNLDEAEAHLNSVIEDIDYAIELACLERASDQRLYTYRKRLKTIARIAKVHRLRVQNILDGRQDRKAQQRKTEKGSEK